MRLGFIADNTLTYDGSTYRYGTGEWQWVERLARAFDEVDICARVYDVSDANSELQKYPFTLNVPNGRVHPLSIMRADGSYANGGWIRRQLDTYNVLRRLSDRWHFAFLVMPGWPAWLAYLAHRRSDWDYAVWARADWSGAAEHRLGYHGVVGTLLRLSLPIYLRFLRLVEYAILRNASIRMTDGLVLADRYPDLASSMFRMADTTLSVDQFRKRRDTCTDNVRTIISVGSIVARKGIDISLKAIASLVAEGFNLRFRIVGEGKEKGNLRNLAKALGIDDRLEFCGYVPNGPQLWDLYFDSDIFLLTSYSEGFPRVIYEALSQSTPVVVTRVGGIPNFLQDERHALLVESGDVESTTRALRRILTNSPLRRKLISSGYEFALGTISNHPMHRIIDEMREKIEDVAGKT